MPVDLLLALVGFAVVSTGTPGPNNMMVLASGASYGYWRTVPHMLGIWSGLAAMLVAAGLGLGRVFELWPGLKQGLSWIAAAYLLWLAYRIATAAAPKSAEARGRPLTLLEAAAFQWINPKAWFMVLTTVSVYLPVPGALGIALAVAAFTGAAAINNSLWALLGQQVARLLTSPARRRAFNWTMAGLLVASLWPILRG